MQTNSHSIIRSLALFFLFGIIAATPAAERAWQDTATYRPPDFEGTFTVEPEFGRKLEQSWRRYEREATPPETAIEDMRRGLRTLPSQNEMPVLRWFGNAFIWNKKPQNADAIEVMYHAAGSTNPSISYNAIYFGLSTVRPMTEPILRTLVNIGMKSEDPNVLSRIAWGGSAQKDRLLHHLQPHLESADPAARSHAQTLQKIFSGELQAFAWAAEQAKIKAKEKHSAHLEKYRATLTSGDSEARHELLDLILRERISLIMDDSFIAAFSSAAEDSDPQVRNQVAIIAGDRWVWHSPDQPAAAIDLMLRLSRDSEAQVRRTANYYGLSTIRSRSDAVVERMLEMAMTDAIDDGDLRGRITWGLARDRDTVRRVLEKWIDGADRSLIKAAFAYGFYLDFFAEKPDSAEKLDVLLETPEKVVARAIAIVPTSGAKFKSMEAVLHGIRDELSEELRSRLLWTNNQGPPFIIVEEREVPRLEKLFLTSAHFKMDATRPLSLQALIRLGKEGSLKSVR